MRRALALAVFLSMAFMIVIPGAASAAYSGSATVSPATPWAYHFESPDAVVHLTYTISVSNNVRVNIIVMPESELPLYQVGLQAQYYVGASQLNSLGGNYDGNLPAGSYVLVVAPVSLLGGSAQMAYSVDAEKNIGASIITGTGTFFFVFIGVIALIIIIVVVLLVLRSKKVRVQQPPAYIAPPPYQAPSQQYQQVPLMFCNGCGRQIQQGVINCPFCGYRYR